MNKPGFVQAAEDRRKRLIELAESREKRCEKYKQLLALTNGKLYNRGDNNDTSTSSVYSSFLSLILTYSRTKKTV